MAKCPSAPSSSSFLTACAWYILIEGNIFHIDTGAVRRKGSPNPKRIRPANVFHVMSAAGRTVETKMLDEDEPYDSPEGTFDARIVCIYTLAN